MDGQKYLQSAAGEAWTMKGASRFLSNPSPSATLREAIKLGAVAWARETPSGDARSLKIATLTQILQEEPVMALDGRATDTVTNFTTLVVDFVTQKLHNIYLITSDDRLRRARAIASIVLGSRGIAVTPLAVSSRA